MAKPKELTVEQLVTKDVIDRLAKRLHMLCRELEVDALDMAMYSSTYARGGFPTTHLIQLANRLEHFAKEIESVKKKWIEVNNVQ